MLDEKGLGFLSGIVESYARVWRFGRGFKRQRSVEGTRFVSSSALFYARNCLWTVLLESEVV